MKHALYIFCAVLLSATSFTTASASEKQVESFVTTLADNVLKTLESGSNEKQTLMKLESLFKKNVDTKWIGRFVLGKHWRSLNEAEQARYLKSYQNFIVKNYTSRFAQFSGQTYELGKTRKQEDGDYLVMMKIIDPKGGPDILTDYRVRKQDGGYRVVDIVVEGVSLITTQRSEFGGFVGQKGIDALIKALDAKAKKIDIASL